MPKEDARFMSHMQTRADTASTDNTHLDFSQAFMRDIRENEEAWKEACKPGRKQAGVMSRKEMIDARMEKMGMAKATQDMSKIVTQLTRFDLALADRWIEILKHWQLLKRNENTKVDQIANPSNKTSKKKNKKNKSYYHPVCAKQLGTKVRSFVNVSILAHRSSTCTASGSVHRWLGSLRSGSKPCRSNCWPVRPRRK